MLPYLFLNQIDQQVAQLLLTDRSDAGITIFSIISFFGNWQLLLPAMLVVVGILLIQNKKKFITPFVATVMGAEFITFLGKFWFNRPRPLLAVFHETDPSFPSGHATIAVALYGYLAYILVKSLKGRYNWLITVVAVLIMLLIGFSRLYLGVHYVSDVLAGYLVGLVALVVGINWTEHR